MNRNDTLYAIDHDLSYVSHTGVPGMEWHKHKFGVWQKQAVYAHGMDDPNAKEKKKKEPKEVDKSKGGGIMGMITRTQAKNDAARSVIDQDPSKGNTEAYKRLTKDRFHKSLGAWAVGGLLPGIGTRVAYDQVTYNGYLKRAKGTLKDTKMTPKRQEIYRATFDKYKQIYSAETKKDWGKKYGMKTAAQTKQS